MSREGDNVLFTADLVHSLKDELEVKVYHKNRNEAGQGTPVGSTVLTSSVGRKTRKASSLKELVRYHIKCNSTGISLGYEYVLFRMLSPVWFDDVKAPA